MSRHLASRPTLAERDALFLDQAEFYFSQCLQEWGPDYAETHTVALIEEALAQRVTGKMRAQVRSDDLMRAAWEAVVERHRPDAVEIARRLRTGCVEDARHLLAHCLAFASPADRAVA